MSALHVTLPVPPSANALTKTVGKRRVSTAAYTRWNFEAWYRIMVAVREQSPAGWGKPLALTIYVNVTRNRDASNVIKPIEDALVKFVPALPDDRWNDEVRVVRSLEPPPGMAFVTIASMTRGEGVSREARTDTSCRSTSPRPAQTKETER